MHNLLVSTRFPWSLQWNSITIHVPNSRTYKFDYINNMLYLPNNLILNVITSKYPSAIDLKLNYRFKSTKHPPNHQQLSLELLSLDGNDN